MTFYQAALPTASALGEGLAASSLAQTSCRVLPALDLRAARLGLREDVDVAIQECAVVAAFSVLAIQSFDNDSRSRQNYVFPRRGSYTLKGCRRSAEAPDFGLIRKQ
jgi:hypothetical protein